MVPTLSLGTLIIIAHTKGALLAKTVGPEAIDGCSAGKVVMGEEKPETEDRLGEDVEHSVSDDFGIDINFAGSISDTPDTMLRQLLV